jgi:hypothetical protein
VVGTAISTRAKWRSSPSARIGTLKSCLTPPTLSERRYYIRHESGGCRSLTLVVELLLQPNRSFFAPPDRQRIRACSELVRLATRYCSTRVSNLCFQSIGCGQSSWCQNHKSVASVQVRTVGAIRSLRPVADVGRSECLFTLAEQCQDSEPNHRIGDG